VARRSFLLYSTIQVKCPREYSEEEAEAVTMILRPLLEESVQVLENGMRSHGFPELKIKVVH
jgi:hypothetical protein